MKITKRSGIYRFINFINGKMYIGSAINLRNRHKDHLVYLRIGKHSNRYFQNAFNKYGKENFIFHILEYVELKENLLVREQYWMDRFKSYYRENGYNISPTAASPLGVKHDEEFRRKVGLRFKNIIRTKEWGDNISKGLTGMKATSIAKINISQALTGRKLSEEHTEKIGNYGRKLDKWPCFNGYYCKCDKCREVKAAKMREYRKSKMEK